MHGPLEVRWEYGVKVLNSAQANQSFGSLHRVWQATFAQARVAERMPRNMLLLGLGGGSVPHILRGELGLGTKITAVEIDPAMTALARQHFGLDQIGDLKLVEGDATIVVHGLQERFDLVVVDLFDELDMARGTDARAFIHGLRERCTIGGLVLVNTVAHDAPSNERCERVLRHLGSVFHTVEELRLEEINRVFVAHG